MSGRRVVGSALVFLVAIGVGCSYPSGPTLATDPSDEGLFPWSLTVTGDRPPLRAEPGGTWAFEFDLEVDLRLHVPEMRRFKRIVAAVYGDLSYDAQGNYRSSASDMVLSSRFATTGVPLAGANMWPSLRLIHGKNGSPFEGVTTFDLPGTDDPARVHRFHGRMEVAVPADIPHGWWHPRFTLLVEVEGLEEPVFLAMFYRERQAPPPRGFPLVEIGRPAPARLPFVAFQDPRIWGRAGTLPAEVEGKLGLVALSTFPTGFILPPGRYPVGPGLPTLSPINAVPEVYNTEGLLPIAMDPELLARLEVSSCSVEGPDGPAPCLRGPEFRPEDAAENAVWAGDSFGVDLTRTGTYLVRLTGHATDPVGRRFEGGGTYHVHSALPLTFSTSCKPGTSFLVGNPYPPKVNVNPPVRAAVEVTVEYWPLSDPARKRVWTASGRCNRLGHFSPTEPRLVFDEPGEYRSEVKATYRDKRGRLWMGSQSSTGVIAPVESDIRLRPASVTRPAQPSEQYHSGRGLLLLNRSPVKTARLPALPLEPSDTLFLAVQPDSLALENRFSVDVQDARLARGLLAASSARSVALPRMHQRRDAPWTFLHDVVLAATAHGLGFGLVWTPIGEGRRTDLPVGPVSRGALDPLSFPGDEFIDGWVTFGAVRPGLSALLGVSQRASWGSGWQLSPNAFGFQVNAGKNGDLPGDVYRVQAGVVLKDLENAINHYDVYASSVVVSAGSLPTSIVLPPGSRPLLSAGGVDQHLFLATDGFSFFEVGESLDFGGMVFPNVPADVTWTATAPSGDVRIVRGRADRRGLVGGIPVAADQEGAWSVRVEARHGDLVGGIPGSPDGSYWACVIPPEAPARLHADVPPVTRIAPYGTARVPLRWPAGLNDVTIHFAAITPGLVIEQGSVRPASPAWEYAFTPTEAVIRAPNFDVRMFQNGYPALADTAVFLFCLEGMDGGRRVADGLSLVLRGDVLLNQADL